MNRKSILVCMVFVLVFSLFSFAFAEENIINVSELKEIEEADTFEVCVSKKEVVRDVGVSIEGSDAIALTIQNNSENTVKDISIYMVAYNENYEQVGLGFAFILTKEPQMFTAQDVNLTANEETVLAVRCNAEDFSGARTIVLSYTTEDGTEVENPAAEEWYDNLYEGADIETKTFD